MTALFSKVTKIAVNLKWMDSMISKIYFNKAVKKKKLGVLHLLH